MDIENQVAVVTGGASGIGLAAAKNFAAHGARVVVADLQVDDLPGDISGVVCDVRSDDQVDHLAETARAQGPIGLVMANAGIAIGGRFEKVPMSEWQRLLDVNVCGVVRTINAFLPDMLEQRSGTIIITGSSAGLFVSDGFNIPYATTKYALHGLAIGLANYCRESGVKVVYLAPRITDTPFPKSAEVWGNKGKRTTSDRVLEPGTDSVDDVIGALVESLGRDDFLVSLTPETGDLMSAYAARPWPHLHV